MRDRLSRSDVLCLTDRCEVRQIILPLTMVLQFASFHLLRVNTISGLIYVR